MKFGRATHLLVVALLLTTCGGDAKPLNDPFGGPVACSELRQPVPEEPAYSLWVTDAGGSVIWASLTPTNFELAVGYRTHHTKSVHLAPTTCNRNSRVVKLLRASAAFVDGEGILSAELATDPNRKVLNSTVALIRDAPEGFSISYIEKEECMRCFAESFGMVMAECGIALDLTLSRSPILNARQDSSIVR